MIDWDDSGTTPTTRMTDGDIEVVEVDYPAFLSSGQAVRFIRVVVELDE